MMLYQPSSLPRLYVLLFEAYVSAGFPSPADDYTEHALDLNELLIKNPPATFFARISDPNLKGLGLRPHDLIVVDRSLKPCHGKLMLVIIDGELKIRRYIKNSQSHMEKLPSVFLTNETAFDLWGVITYVIRSV
ncbi:MAG: S24 family peptidase [Janthinobacterium lividum]